MVGENTSLRSAGWVSLCSLVQLILQFAFQVYLAKRFGASWEMDSYVASMALPTAVSAVLVGSLGYAFVPQFSRLLTQDATRAWQLAGSMGTIQAVCGLTAALITFFSAEFLAAWLFPGFTEGRSSLAVSLLRIQCWLIVVNGFIAFLQALHHCHKRFLLPAVAAPIGIAATLIAAVAWEGGGMAGVAWAVVAGSTVTVLLQLPLLLRHGRFGVRLDEDLRRCLALLLPLMLGALYFRLDPLVDRYLASELPVGSVAHLGYAWRMASAMLLITVGGLSVVAFPSFAEHWTAGRKTEFRAEIAASMRCLSAILVPLAFALTFYSTPLVADLFQRGAFSATDSRQVGLLLMLYAGMIIGAGVGEIISKVFYSLSDTRTPTLLGVGTFTVGLILKITFVERFGVSAVVAATSFYFLLSAALAVMLMVRRLGPGVLDGIGGALRRSVLASLLAAAAAWPVAGAGFPLATLVAAMWGGLVYLGALFAQKDEFALRMGSYLSSWLGFGNRGS